MGERTAAERKRRGEFWVDLGEFPTVINFSWPRVCAVPSCWPWAEAGALGSLAAGGEGGLAGVLFGWDLRPPLVLFGLSGGLGPSAWGRAPSVARIS